MNLKIKRSIAGVLTSVCSLSVLALPYKFDTVYAAEPGLC